MEEVKEEVQTKPEVKEEEILPLIESGIKLESNLTVIKTEDNEFLDALVNIDKEEKSPVKVDCETEPSIITSLVPSWGGVDEDDLSLKKMNAKRESIKKGLHEEKLASRGSEVDKEGDSEENFEVIAESEFDADELDGGNIGCIVSFEAEESMEYFEDSFLKNSERCEDCEEVFECKESLLEHMKNVHRKKSKCKGSKFTCGVCGMEFKYKANFKKHEKLHDDIYHFKCKYCNITFKQSLTLKNHYIYVHATEKPYKCEFCESTFKSTNNLKAHVEVHHGTGEMFACEFCPLEFKRKCYLKRHLLVHTNPDKKFTCDDCGLKCRSKTDIAKHVLTHLGVVEKNFFCEICGAGFSKRAHVTRHGQTHTVEKSFACELCDRAYKDQYSLKIHHETVHLGITYSCEICGFQSDRHSVKKHMKRCAEGQKKYTCEVCHKEYFLKKWFDFHISKCR